MPHILLKMCQQYKQLSSCNLGLYSNESQNINVSKRHMYVQYRTKMKQQGLYVTFENGFCYNLLDETRKK